MIDQAPDHASTSPMLDLPELVLLHDAPEAFLVLLQGGFEMLVPRPCTVREFICELVGVCGDYAQKQIQTVFVDGKAIDDLDEALLGPGSRLALSAALPGLVGATMRRSGFYSRLREGITHHAGNESATVEAKPFRLQVRLFNTVGRDLAAIFLKYGVIIFSTDLRRFLATRPTSFLEALRGASINNAPLPVDQSALEPWPLSDGDVFLRVQPHVP